MKKTNTRRNFLDGVALSVAATSTALVAAISRGVSDAGAKLAAAYYPLLLTALLAAMAGCGTERPQVITKEGMLGGEFKDGAQVFVGIPFAAPPVGERRWQPPREVAPWSGVLDATDFGPACPQPRRYGSMIPQSRTTDEDCLRLNVSAPVEGDKLPVLVMIHGGGTVAGSGEYIFQTAPIINAEGVILVTFNYRLGVLGFFAHPELDGSEGVNFGLMDMTAALRWVNRNIAAFGGDPARVTILGVSAGGMAVDMLMATPASTGLIAGGIAQSGYGTWPLPRTRLAVPLRTSPSAESMALQMAAEATGKSAEEVTRSDLYAVKAGDWLGVVDGFHLPIVDGISLPEESAILFAQGKQHRVPFMSGGTSFDGSVYGISGVGPETLLGLAGDRADKVRELWAADFAISEEQGMSRFFGDIRYVYAARNMTRSMQRVERPGYLYFFEHVAKDQRGKVPGADHAAAMAALWTEFDLPIAATMRDYWFNFIKTGNPNGEGLPPWPIAAAAGATRWAVFGDTVKIKDDVLTAKMKFIDELWQARAKPVLRE